MCKASPTKFRKKNQEKEAIEKCKEKQRKPADKFHEQNEMSTVNLPYTLLLSYVLLVVVFFFTGLVSWFACWFFGLIIFFSNALKAHFSYLGKDSLLMGFTEREAERVAE